MTGHLYADEDFPLGAVQILRGWGHDVLTVGAPKTIDEVERICAEAPRLPRW